jgi:hypothetical protein
MATFQTEDGEVERPLIFDNPELVKQIARLRDLIANAQGETGEELVGLRDDGNGGWRGVFRRR